MRYNGNGVGSYNSEHRSFNRGFGREHPRAFQSSQREPSTQTARKGDLFIEAGRLAVEYLVTNGSLSANVFSGKYQNDTFKNSIGEFRDHQGSQDRETISNSRGDGFSGNRKTPKDEDTNLFRNYSRERRRLGVSRSYNSDWSREGSFSDRVAASQGMDIEDDKRKGKSKDGDSDTDTDTDIRNSNSKESPPKDTRHSELQGEIGEPHHVHVDSTMTSSVQKKDEKELLEGSNLTNTECEETRYDTEQRAQDCEEKNADVDLIKLCSSIKIPTKVRSSLTNKSLKSDSLLINELKNDNECDSVAPMKDDTMNAGNLSPVYAVNKPMIVDSVQCSDQSTVLSEPKTSEQPELDKCSIERGEKRAFEEDDIREDVAKRTKEWLSVAQSDAFSQLSELRGDQSLSPAYKIAPTNQESFTNMSLSLKGSIESAKEPGEGKQLIGNSFKIFDLNFMQASDMHEGRDAPLLMFSSIANKSKSSLIDVDLSMNNNRSLSGSYNDCGTAKKDIEIIDLESETLPEGENMNSSTRIIAEADTTNVRSFQKSSHNPDSNVDGQDGYGFMISEFLGNDVSHCSSVQPDMNPLENDIDLQHEEGMFAEDDSIYMSLGEIPINLLRGWDQPTQEKNPFEM